ncbi:hypothetical protein D9M73_193280 [compost metagenome]
MADQPHRDPGLGGNLADRRPLETMALEAHQRRLDQIGLAQLRFHAGKTGFLIHGDMLLRSRSFGLAIWPAS